MSGKNNFCRKLRHKTANYTEKAIPKQALFSINHKKDSFRHHVPVDPNNMVGNIADCCFLAIIFIFCRSFITIDRIVNDTAYFFGQTATFQESDMNLKPNKKLAILNAIKEQGKPVSSKKISEMLASCGLNISDRTIRMYLSQLDREGLTLSHGKKGRTLSDTGKSELHSSQIMHRPGYLSAKIDQMIYNMNFDLPTCSGKVVVNTSIVDADLLMDYADKICKVFEYGYGMGKLLMLAEPGEVIGEHTIPQGKVGFCTVCSITVNGILLKHGIPMTSRFGGLLKLNKSKPFRFVEMIHYDGTSIDPLEVFIRSGMTDYHRAITTGDGLIGASFQEVPSQSKERIININQRLIEIGLGAISEIGMSGQPLLEIPVSHGRVGVILVGGLNPIAILEENDHRIFSRAISTFVEYDRLFNYNDLKSKLKKIIRTTR